MKEVKSLNDKLFEAEMNRPLERKAQLLANKWVQAAKEAGVFAVAFLSDPSIRAEIEAEQPNMIITDMRELLDLLDENHEWAYERI